MDLWSIIKIVVRRWYIFLGGVILTVVVVSQVGKTIDPTYETSAAVLFTAPGPVLDPDESVIDNPFLRFSSSLRFTAVAVGRVMNSTSEQARLADAGLPAAYATSLDNNGPILTVTVIGGSATDVIETGHTVLEEIDAKLLELQGGAEVSEGSLIEAQAIVLPTIAIEQNADRRRALIAVGALGTAASVSLALLLESLSGIRRIRQPAEAFPGRRESDEQVFSMDGETLPSTEPVSVESPAESGLPTQEKLRR